MVSVLFLCYMAIRLQGTLRPESQRSKAGSLGTITDAAFAVAHFLLGSLLTHSPKMM